MGSNLLGDRVADVLAAVFDRNPASLLVVNPSARTVESVVRTADGTETTPTIRILANDAPLKQLAGGFSAASAAADLVADDALELRTAAELPSNALLVTEARVVSLVAAGERIGGVATDDDAFRDAVSDAYESDWERATPFELRTPPRSTVDSTLSAALGDDVRADFDAMLAAADSSDKAGLDEVTLSLLAAASHDKLLYDISRWGEDAGVASKATFSRTKTELEEAGLITTEKVPIDVGRPRLRLLLADEQFEDASPEGIVSVAQSVLATSS